MFNSSGFKCPVQIFSFLNLRPTLDSCVPGLASSFLSCTMARTLLRQRYVVIYQENTSDIPSQVDACSVPQDLR